jgi:hypothetical protein
LTVLVVEALLLATLVAAVVAVRLEMVQRRLVCLAEMAVQVQPHL